MRPSVSARLARIAPMTPTGETTKRMRVMAWWQDAKHPIWKVAQGLIALAMLIVGSYHGIELADGQHAARVDLGDVTGLGGLGVTGKLLWDYFRT